MLMECHPVPLISCEGGGVAFFDGAPFVEVVAIGGSLLAERNLIAKVQYYYGPLCPVIVVSDGAPLSDVMTSMFRLIFLFQECSQEDLTLF